MPELAGVPVTSCPAKKDQPSQSQAETLDSGDEEEWKDLGGQLDGAGSGVDESLESLLG